MIYLDNAATSWPKPPSVKEAVAQAFDYAANPGRGAHQLAMKSAREVFKVREKIKDLINAESTKNIAFTKNCTEGLNIAMFGSLQAGDHVITSVYEHNSILRPLHVLEERGIELDILDCPIDDLPDNILRAIKPNTRMVAISHVDNLVGRVKDIKKIGNSLSRDILFLVDAAQSIGHMPIDVEEARIDLLAAPGHKALMGPMGTGFLYVRDETSVLPFMVGGTGSRSQSLVHPDFAPDKYEAGTENLHGIVGLGAGIDWINEIGIENIEAHVKDLAKTFYKLVKDLPGVIIYGIESEEQITSIVSLNIKDRDSAEVAMALDREGEVAVRSQMHCAPLSHKHFHTLDQGMVRFSFGYFNTMDEVHEAAKILEKIIQDN